MYKAAIKGITILFTVMGMVLLCVQFVYADERIIKSGECDGVPWRINSDKELVIGENGKEYTFTDRNSREYAWYDLRASVESVRFEGTVHGKGSQSNMFELLWFLKSVDFTGFETSEVTNMSGMFCGCHRLLSVNFAGIDTSNVTDMSYMFTECYILPSIDLSDLDTGRVTDMSNMFSLCGKLRQIDLSGLDTSRVTNMSGMFGTGDQNKNSSLISVNFSGIDTSNVTDMTYMFRDCTSLTSIDLSDLDTDNVTSMQGMFNSCYSLTSIDLSVLNTGNVANMDGMFYRCSSLTSIDLSNLDTGNVANMNGMFYDCSSLTSIDLSTIDTSNVADMSAMFRNCTSLTSINLSNLDTSNLGTMEQMFYGCSAIKKLDLSTIDFSNISNGTYMIYDCNQLAVLKMGRGLEDNWYSECKFPVDMYDFDTGIMYNKDDYIPDKDYGIYVIDMKIDPDNYDPDYITEDQLFGEYSRYLINKSYDKMEASLVGTAYELIAIRNGWDDAASALKYNMVHPDKAAKALIECALGENWSEEKANKAIAIEMINNIKDNEQTAATIVKQMGEWSGRISSAYGLASQLKTDRDMVKLIKMLPEGTKFTEKQALEFWNKLFEYAKQENKVEKVGDKLEYIDKGITLADICFSSFCIIQMDLTLIDELKSEIDTNSGLYKGLCEIEDNIIGGFFTTAGKDIIEKFVLNEAVKWMQKEGVKSFAELITMFKGDMDWYASAEYAVASLGYKLLGSVAPGMSLDKVDSAWISVHNALMFQNAVREERSKIIDNYTNNGGLSIQELKDEYNQLYDHYVVAIKMAYEKVTAAYEGSILDKWLKIYEGETDELKDNYKKYYKKLTFRKYLNSCLVNANSDWECALVDGKYQIVKHYEKKKIKPISTSSKLSLRTNLNSGDMISDYCLDIPEEIDGHKIEGVSGSVFAENQKITCIYIPGNIKSLGEKAFASCQALDTVFMDAGLETIGPDAFKQCTALYKLDVPGTINEISTGAFDETQDLLLRSESDIVESYAAENNNTFIRNKKELAKVEISQMPEKLVYEWDEKIDPEGLALELTYVDGTTEIVTYGFGCLYDDKKPGQNTVNVYIENKMVTYEVTVNEKATTYTVSYIDDYGSSLRDDEVFDAVIGKTIIIEIPSIEGYKSPEETELLVEEKDNIVVLQYISEKTAIEDGDIQIEEKVLYTGEEVKPEISINCGGTVLKEGIDYDIELIDNVDLGLGMIIITGKGEYKGSVIYTFDITDKKYYTLSLVFDSTMGTVTGAGTYEEGTKITISATCKSGYEFDGFYYNEKKYAGTYVDGAYLINVSSISKDMVIEAIFVEAQEDDETVSMPYSYLKYKRFTYNGKTKNPCPVVYDSETYDDLVKNVDYKVVYESSRKKIGTHYVIIKYIGKYSEYDDDYLTFNIYPGRTSIVSRRGAKKRFTIKFKKLGGGVKYKVQYKTGKGKWKTKKTSRNKITIKRLKARKKYKVRVRAYKNVDWLTYSGKWSKVKTVKTK